MDTARTLRASVKEGRSEPKVPVPVQGVCYQVRNRADKRQRLAILSQVSAYFNPSEMAAVMGPSGSGAPAPCAHVPCPPSEQQRGSPSRARPICCAPPLAVQLCCGVHRQRFLTIFFTL